MSESGTGRTYMVLVFDGDVPEKVMLAAHQVFCGATSAWNHLSGEVIPSAFVEFLGTDEEGPARRRRQVIDRLYANEPSELKEPSA